MMNQLITLIVRDFEESHLEIRLSDMTKQFRNPWVDFDLVNSIMIHKVWFISFPVKCEAVETGYELVENLAQLTADAGSELAESVTWYTSVLQLLKGYGDAVPIRILCKSIAKIEFKISNINNIF